MAKKIMIQGTMSNVGKSIITAGICRILKEEGYKVAPFKSQNMALNSFITQDGLEMGRAQVVQAEACGVPPDVRMNPILLKPTTDTGSQVIVNGCVWGQMDAKTYFKKKKELKKDVLSAFHSLEEDFDVIVIEGAGSPAEINLNSEDIVNMGLAEMVDAPVILVGDIDRGGIFATLFGTIELLSQEEKQRIKGVIINKFRGDVEILKPGLVQLEQLISRPVLGVLPYMPLELEDEDSLSTHLEQRFSQNILDIAVIQLPKLSNFTDFTALSCQEFVSLRYVKKREELKNPDIIILPGTKNTISDLLWLRQNGLESAIKKAVAKEIPVMGICGGFQMLGDEIADPDCVEMGGIVQGMGLLPLKTIFATEKTRTRVEGKVEKLEGFFADLSHASFQGYEIHMGETSPSECPFSILNTEKIEGAVGDFVFGTYIHGIFDYGTFASCFVQLLLNKKGITGCITPFSYEEHKESQFQLLSQTMRNHLDINAILNLME